MLVKSLDSATDSSSPAINSPEPKPSGPCADDGAGFAITLVLAATFVVVLAAALAGYFNALN